MKKFWKKHDKQTNPEQRDTYRTTHVAPILVKEIHSGMSYRVRMLNISRNGIYFETDRIIKPGTEIHIVIKNSSETSSSEVYDYYRGEIRWRKKFEDAYFDYGYGVRLIDTHHRHNPVGASRKDEKEMRRNSRKPYSKPIFFATQNEVFEGLIKNISSTGIQIQASGPFKVGQILTMAIPLKSDHDFRIRGQIVWANENRFGVIFLRKEKSRQPIYK